MDAPSDSTIDEQVHDVQDLTVAGAGEEGSCAKGVDRIDFDGNGRRRLYRALELVGHVIVDAIGVKSHGGDSQCFEGFNDLGLCGFLPDALNHRRHQFRYMPLDLVSCIAGLEDVGICF